MLAELPGGWEQWRQTPLLVFMSIIKLPLQLLLHQIVRLNRSLTALNSRGWFVLSMLKWKTALSLKQKTPFVFKNEPLHLGL